MTPAELRATSRHLEQASGRMKGVKSVLGEKLCAEGPGWGEDRIGDQFAKGGVGYLAQLEWVFGSIDAKTGLLDDLSRALNSAADSFEQQDRA